MAITRIKSSNIEDGTVANVDIADLDSTKLTGTIASARLSNVDLTTLSATNLTSGTIADARVPASAVTQHVTATDLTAVHQGIATLGLHMGVADNKTAFNLPNSFIDTFEDDTGLTTQTDVDRVISGEYVASVYSALSTPAYITGDRTSRITVTQSGWSLTQGTIDNMVDGTISEVAATAILGTATSDNTGDYFNFDFGSAVNVSEFKWYRNATTTIGAWQFSGSANADHSSSVNLGSTFTLGGVASGAHPGTPQIVTAMSANTTAYRYYRITGTGGTSTGGNWDSEIEFKEATEASAGSATGTLISDTQTAPSAITETSGVILYTDNAGTNVLGTDLKIYMTANNGTNWTEAASYGTPQTFSGTTKQVKLGKTTVTSGTQVALKAVWANQVATVPAVAAAYETGNRQSTITVTSTGFTINEGAVIQIVDGVIMPTSSRFVFNNQTPSAGAYIRFTHSTARVFTEVKWYGCSAANATWKWQGSNDGSSFTDIGGSFTLGGVGGGQNAEQLQTTLNANTTAYTIYQLTWISGAVNGNDYQKEVEFKAAAVAAVAGKEAHLNGWAVNY